MSKRIVPVFFILLLPYFLKSQIVDPEYGLKQYATNPGEKIYISFDKSEYVVGETIQYKAFVISGLQLSDLSTNIYVELLDEMKKVIYRNVIPVIDGVSFGSFVIPGHLNENVYYFRAYTRWMLNWDDRLNFIEPIKIYNPSSKSPLSAPPLQYKPEVHVESNNLLDSLPANVAIRLIQEGSLPLNWSGYLYEKSNSSEPILTFQNHNEEFSSFRFIPYFGRDYAVKITDDSGNSAILDLPRVQKHGVNLQVLNLDSAVIFNLFSTRGYLQKYRIFAHANGELIYNGIIKTDISQFSGRIRMDSICVGIIHLSVFDPEGNILIERMVFPNIQRVSVQQPLLDVKKISDQPGGSNEVDMIMNHSLGGNYLIQVVKNIIPQNPPGWNLLCALYLGDLIKRPYNAERYFSDTSKKNSAALDALMISEKWTRFQWTNLMEDKNNKFPFHHDSYLSFTGKISRNYKMLSNKEMTVYIELPDLSQSFSIIKTDAIGSFVLDGQYFYDTAKLYFMDNQTSSFPNDISVTMRKNVSFRPFIGELPKSYIGMKDRQESDSISPAIQYYAAYVENKQRERRWLDSLSIKGKNNNFLLLQDGSPAATISGYEVVKLDNEFDASTNLPLSQDLRSVLYWNPSISLQNRYTFKFTNSSIPGKYRITIIGFNKTGQPVLFEKTL